MATALALCDTFGCSGLTVFEDAPSCFRPKAMPCPACQAEADWYEANAHDFSLDR